MKAKGQLIEVVVTDALRAELAAFLFREGASLAVGDIFSPMAMSAELGRRGLASVDLADAILALLSRNAIQPIDLDVQAACARLVDAKRS